MKKQTKLGTETVTYEEICYICGKELNNPNYYETADFDLSFVEIPLCDTHNTWKWQLYIEAMPYSLFLSLPFTILFYKLKEFKRSRDKTEQTSAEGDTAE